MQRGELSAGLHNKSEDNAGEASGQVSACPLVAQPRHRPQTESVGRSEDGSSHPVCQSWEEVDEEEWDGLTKSSLEGLTTKVPKVWLLPKRLRHRNKSQVWALLQISAFRCKLLIYSHKLHKFAFGSFMFILCLQNLMYNTKCAQGEPTAARHTVRWRHPLIKYVH